jgi:hypothetical protein
MGLPSARSSAFSANPDAQALRRSALEKNAAVPMNSTPSAITTAAIRRRITIAVVAREQDPVRTTALTGDVDQFGNGDSGPPASQADPCFGLLKSCRI